MAEYYERVLLNHILSAYDPCKGMCVYFTPMRPAHYRVYGSEDHSFWCCNQSGLETPAKLNRMVFTKQGRDLMVNLFVPAAVTWKERHVSLIQQASMPESPEVTLILKTGRDRELGLLVRKPSWSPEAVLTLNGPDNRPGDGFGRLLGRPGAVERDGYAENRLQPAHHGRKTTRLGALFGIALRALCTGRAHGYGLSARLVLAGDRQRGQ